MGATRPASGIKAKAHRQVCKKLSVSLYLVYEHSNFFLMHETMLLKKPTRDASPPLEVAFLNKIGCGSDMKTKVLGLSFCISLTLHYLCRGYYRFL